MPKPSKGIYTDEHKKKISDSVKKRWDNMTIAYEIRFRKARSEGMKKYWMNKSAEERKAIGKKIQEVIVANQIKKHGELGIEDD